MNSKTVPVLLAIAAFLLAAARINHGLMDSGLPAGAGLTFDESFNIEQGVYVFDAFCHHGPLFLTPSVAREVFGSHRYFPDHPPLARALLAAVHHATSWAIPGAERSALNIPAARLGSCLAFAIMVLLLSEFTRRRYGPVTAIAAAVALMLMPRVVGLARLATQETWTSLAWLAAFAPLWVWWTKPDAPTTRQSLISGVLWGVLLATKVQGLLVPPLLIGWALWQYRRQALRPLALWGFTGAAVFFVSWPWLWLDPVPNTLSYLSRTAERPTIYVWYFGTRYADKAVPWHFPFVMTAITVPLIVFAFFVLRLVRRRLETVEQLVLLSIVWPLIVFALPGTPVYDGSRLFVVIMPAVALLAARGVAGFVAHTVPADSSDEVHRHAQRTQVIRCVVVVIAALVSLARVVQPFCLDGYSVVVGGAAGAQKLGMEASYWADGLNGDFWRQVPENATIYVAPVTHQFQLSDAVQLVPVVAARNIRLVPFEYDAQEQRGLVLLIHRLADLRPALRRVPRGAPVIAEARYGSVILARLIDTTEHTWPELPDWPEN